VRWIAAIGIGILAVLSGCMSEAQITAESIEAAKAHCTSEGKQFVLRSTEKKPGGFFEPKRIVVAGDCLGPGDPGYVAPASGGPSNKPS